jgi:hypothetical protein
MIGVKLEKQFGERLDGTVGDVDDECTHGGVTAQLKQRRRSKPLKTLFATHFLKAHGWRAGAGWPMLRALREREIASLLGKCSDRCPGAEAHSKLFFGMNPRFALSEVGRLPLVLGAMVKRRAQLGAGTIRADLNNSRCCDSLIGFYGISERLFIASYSLCEDLPGIIVKSLNASAQNLKIIEMRSTSLPGEIWGRPGTRGTFQKCRGAAQDASPRLCARMIGLFVHFDFKGGN